MRGEYISSPFFAEGEKASGNSNSARKEIPKRAIPLPLFEEKETHAVAFRICKVLYISVVLFSNICEIEEEEEAFRVFRIANHL